MKTLVQIILLAICSVCIWADVPPIVIADPQVPTRHQLTKSWSVAIKGDVTRRIEKEAVVLSKPGLSCWAIVYKFREGESPEQRFRGLKATRVANPLEEWEEAAALPMRFASVVQDSRLGNGWVVYAFVVGSSSHISMAVFCDSRDQLEEAKQIWKTISDQKRRAEPSATDNPDDAQ